MVLRNIRGQPVQKLSFFTVWQTNKHAESTHLRFLFCVENKICVQDLKCWALSEQQTAMLRQIHPINGKKQQQSTSVHALSIPTDLIFASKLQRSNIKCIDLPFVFSVQLKPVFFTKIKFALLPLKTNCAPLFAASGVPFSKIPFPQF